jgi:hypothetical protein
MFVNNVLNLVYTLFFTQMLNITLNNLLKKNTYYNKYAENRQRYITKNIVKSILLCFISVITIKPLYDIILYNKWNNSIIHTLGSLYVSNDILGLLCIDNLPKSTKFHHIVASLLLFLNFNIDYTEINTSSIEIGKLLVVYVIFSSYSFLVNYTLGYRFLTSSNSKILAQLKQVSFYTYLLSCMINWSIQLVFLYRFKNMNVITKLVYIGVMMPIVNDDLLLLDWLRS